MTAPTNSPDTSSKFLWAKSRLHDAFVLVDPERRIARWARIAPKGGCLEDQRVDLKSVVPEGTREIICAVSASTLFLCVKSEGSLRPQLHFIGWDRRKDTTEHPRSTMPTSAELDLFRGGRKRVILSDGSGSRLRVSVTNNFPYIETGPEFFGPGLPTPWGGRPFCYRQGGKTIRASAPSASDEAKFTLRKGRLLVTAPIHPGNAPVDVWLFPSPWVRTGEAGRHLFSVNEAHLDRWVEILDLWGTPGDPRVENVCVITRDAGGVVRSYDFDTTGASISRRIGVWCGFTRLGAWAMIRKGIRDDALAVIGPNSWPQAAWSKDLPGSKLVFVQETWKGAIVGLETAEGNPIFRFLAEAPQVWGFPSV